MSRKGGLVSVSHKLKSTSDIVKAFGIPRSHAYAVNRISGFIVMPRNSPRNAWMTVVPQICCLRTCKETLETRSLMRI